MNGDKKQRLAELWASYEQAQEVAQTIYRQHNSLADEIAAENARFPVGSVIAINKTRWVKISGYGYNAKHHKESYQEKYTITHISDSYVRATRIKKDGTKGAEKRLYSWDINKAELVEPK